MALDIIVKTQPSSTTVYEKGTATFYVAGSASENVTITYQWQTGTNNGSYSNIANATGSSYSTSPELTNTGTWYRCALSAATWQSPAVNSNGVQLSAIADSRVVYARFGEAGYNRYLRLRNLGYV